MKNRRGQALVEFIMILPIMIMILMAMVDFGNILSNKYTLENDLDNVIDLYQANKQGEIDKLVNEKKYALEYEKDNQYVNVSLSKSVSVVTPLLNNILGKHYLVKASQKIVEGKDED